VLVLGGLVLAVFVLAVLPPVVSALVGFALVPPVLDGGGLDAIDPVSVSVAPTTGAGGGGGNEERDEMARSSRAAARGLRPFRVSPVACGPCPKTLASCDLRWMMLPRKRMKMRMRRLWLGWICQWMVMTRMRRRLKMEGVEPKSAWTGPRAAAVCP